MSRVVGIFLRLFMRWMTGWFLLAVVLTVYIVGCLMAERSLHRCRAGFSLDLLHHQERMADIRPIRFPASGGENSGVASSLALPVC